MGKMSMRVGNRLNSTIVRARMKRIAKTKTFTTKQQRTQKSTSGSSGQSISQLLSKELNANSGKTSSAERYLQTGRRRFCTVVWRRLRNVWKNGWESF